MGPVNVIPPVPDTSPLKMMVLGDIELLTIRLPLLTKEEVMVNVLAPLGVKQVSVAPALIVSVLMVMLVLEPARTGWYVPVPIIMSAPELGTPPLQLVPVDQSVLVPPVQVF